jgi:TPR repeat
VSQAEGTLQLCEPVCQGRRIAMMLSKAKMYPQLFAVVLVLSALNILHTFPTLNEYYFGADEGVYYRQATIVKERGLTGLRETVDQYLGAPATQIFPSPFRLGHLLLASVAVSLKDSIISLSYLSLACYVVLCVVSFVFASHFWPPKVAFVMGVAWCASPVARGLARRALMDSEYWLISAATLFAFLYFIELPTTRRFMLFLGLATAGLCVKETTIFFLPFFVLVLLWLRFKYREPITARHFLAMLVPPILVFVIYTLILGGASWAPAMFNVLFGANILQPTSYHLAYESGPWYSYMVDYFVLSPLFSLLFFLFCGYYLAQSEKSRPITVLLVFFVYHLVPFAFLPKNVRYAVDLDTVYRLCGSLMLVMLLEQYFLNPRLRKILLVGSLALMIHLDVATYYKMFITHKVYDLVSSNFLTVEKFVPSSLAVWAGGNDPSSFSTNDLESRTADNHFQLSLRYYQTGQFENAIEEAGAALKLRPEFAEAYNNMGAAYGALGLWEKEISACEKALLIRPDFQLAKNNLEWAKSQLRKECIRRLDKCD